MPVIPIYFFTENIRFSPKKKKDIKTWLNSSALHEGFKINTLNYIFCDDEYLLSINQKYLSHDTFTDIITFDNRFEDDKSQNRIEGDIFISYERVKENALTYKVSTDIELKRVMIHGLLHLMGYKDKTVKQKNQIREKENLYIKSANF